MTKAVARPLTPASPRLAEVLILCFCAGIGSAIDNSPRRLGLRGRQAPVPPSLLDPLNLRPQEESHLDDKELVSVQEFACLESSATIDSSYLLELGGDWITQTNDWVGPMQTILVEAYNQLAFGLCDLPLFREITNATANPIRYQKASNSTTVQIALQAKCHNPQCTLDTPLFSLPPSDPSPENSTTSFASVSFSISRQQRPATNNYCICPTAATEFRAPTLGEYTQSLYRNIEEKLDINTREEPLVALEEVPCSSNISTFTSFVFLDLNMTAKLTDPEKRALEETFQSVYNQLSWKSCDPYFRTILQTELQVTSPIASDIAPVVPRPSASSVFSVVGQCRGCQVSLSGSFRLFDDALRRRFLAAFHSRQRRGRALMDSNYDKDAMKHSVQDSASCICPVLSHGDLGTGGLEEDEESHKDLFLHQFNQELVELQGQGHGTAVASGHDLEEAQQVTCGRGSGIEEGAADNEVKTFTTTVYADITGSLDELGRDIKALLESTFLRIYNTLSFELCDSNFRIVTDVTLESIQGLTGEYHLGEEVIPDPNIYESRQDTTELPTSAVSTNVFAISGSCRNCDVSESGTFQLFEDVFRRRAPSLLSTGYSRGTTPNRGSMTSSSKLFKEADLCLCPVGVSPGQNEGLSAEEFRFVFNEEMEKKQATLDASMGVSVDVLVEGEEVECNATQEHFTSDVFSDLKVNLTSLTREEVALLEDTFKSTYNNLAFSNCDGNFRAIESVQLRVGKPELVFGPSRRLHEHNGTLSIFNLTNGGNSSFFNSSYLAAMPAPKEASGMIGATIFSVRGSCRNCQISESGTFNLFDDAFRRSLSQSKTKQLTRALPGTCICPAGVPPAVDQGPSALQFEADLIETLEELSTEGKAVSVADTASAVTEAQEVDCNAETLDFSSVTFMDIGVDASELSLEEKKALEESYKDAYNGLSFSSCDEFFRKVAKVQLVSMKSIDTRRQLVGNFSSSNSTLSLNGTLSQATPDAQNGPAGSAVFLVTGRCRNCPMSDSGGFALFDDAFRFRQRSRRLSRRTMPSKNLMEDESLCVCPIGEQPGEQEPVAVGEFLDELNTKIEEVKEKGVVLNVEQIDSLVENVTAAEAVKEFVEIQAQTGTPTFMPSLMPSPSPTMQFTSEQFKVPLANMTASEKFNILATNVTVPPVSDDSPALAAVNITLPPLSASPTSKLAQPSTVPTLLPSRGPMQRPIQEPTGRPTQLPTRLPTPVPTSEPTPDPTSLPTRQPTEEPTLFPSHRPSLSPTIESCAQEFSTAQASFYVNVTGNFTRVNDATMENAFITADSMVARNACSPHLIAVVVARPTALPSSSPILSTSTRPTTIKMLAAASTAFPTRNNSNDAAEGSGRKGEESPEKTPDGFDDFDSEKSKQNAEGNPNNAARDVNSLRLGHGWRHRVLTKANSGKTDKYSRWLQLEAGWQMLTFIVDFQQVNDEFLYPTEPAVQAFLVGFNSQPELIKAGVTAVGARSTTDTLAPNELPSVVPSPVPSHFPSHLLASQPSNTPSSAPSESPSKDPSMIPSGCPSSAAPSELPSTDPSGIPSKIPSSQPSNHPSGTASDLPSVDPSAVPSHAPSYLASRDPSSPPSLSPSMQPSTLPSIIPSESPSSSAPIEHYSPSSFPSPAPSGQPSSCPSSAPNELPSFTPSMLPSEGPSPVFSTLPSNSPSSAPIELLSLVPSMASSRVPININLLSNQPSNVPSLMPFSQQSTFPSMIPSEIPSTSDPSEHPSSAPSDLPSAVPSSSASSELPSDAPSMIPSGHPSLLLSSPPSHHPSFAPSELPSLDPSIVPSQWPSFPPSQWPSSPPSSSPSNDPSSAPSKLPSVSPSVLPSRGPSQFPSRNPSGAPSSVPSMRPSMVPSEFPSSVPSSQPSHNPSAAPSELPSNPPSVFPSECPSLCPSSAPSTDPSSTPSKLQSLVPSNSPTHLPSIQPSNAPSLAPSMHPSIFPSMIPSFLPSSHAPSASASSAPSMTPSDTPTTHTPSQLPTTLPSPLPSKMPSGKPSNLPSAHSFPSLGDKATLSAAIENWILFQDTTYGPTINDWDVSRVADFSYLFRDKNTFNDNISAWHTSQVTNIQYMFRSASAFNQDVASWDVGAVTNMSGLFFGASTFNQDISSWDVTAVTQMFGTFYDALKFNGDISSWDVTKVSNMWGMFYTASEFNRDISSWNVARVIDMEYMFQRAHKFNQDLSNWNVARVTDMYSMFEYAHEFNQDISRWDVAKVTSMIFMFKDAYKFNHDISSWDVSSVTAMSFMFSSAHAFNQNLCSWGPTIASKIPATSWMFHNTACPSTSNPDLGATPVSPLCHLCVKPSDEPSTTPSISPTRLMSVVPSIVASHIPSQASSSQPSREPSPPPSKPPSSAPSMHASILPSMIPSHLPSSHAPSASASSAPSMIPSGTPTTHTPSQKPSDEPSTAPSFSPTELMSVVPSIVASHFPSSASSSQPSREPSPSPSKLPSVAPSAISSSIPSGLPPSKAPSSAPSDLPSIGMSMAPSHVPSSFPSIAISTVPSQHELPSLAPSSVLSFVSSMSPSIQLSNAPSLAPAFPSILDRSELLAAINTWIASGDTTYGPTINDWDVSRVTDFSTLFAFQPFNDNISGWQTSQVTNMHRMFAFASAFNQDLSSWDVAAVTTMSSLFQSASVFNQDLSSWNVAAVTKTSLLFYSASVFNQDISNWNVAAVTNMDSMFSSATSFNQDISSWDVANVKEMDYMFYYASLFNQDLSRWNVAAVADMSFMFYSASGFNQDISSWNVAAVTNMSYMFSSATSFNQDISSWDVASAREMDYMFYYASVFNQDISSWNVAAVTDMSYMFSFAHVFNQDLSSWNVEAVFRMEYMFSSAISFNQNLCSWGSTLASTRPVMTAMFFATGCPSSMETPDRDATPVSPLCGAC